MPYNRKKRKILADATVFNILFIGYLRQKAALLRPA